MTADVFDQVKSRVDIKDAAEMYGVAIRGNMASCPFHGQDKHPSMSFKRGRFKCFSCGEGGSVIDLAAKLYDLDVIGAVKKLNHDFSLGIDLDKPVDTKEAAKRRSENELHKAFREWEHKAQRAYADYYRRLRTYLLKAVPHEGTEDMYARATHQINVVEYKLDILLERSFEDKLLIYKHCRKEVAALEKRRGSQTTERA